MDDEGGGNEMDDELEVSIFRIYNMSDIRQKMVIEYTRRKDEVLACSEIPWSDVDYLKKFIDPLFTCRVILDNFDEIETSDFDCLVVWDILTRYIAEVSSDDKTTVQTITIDGKCLALRDFREVWPAEKFVKTFLNEDVGVMLNKIVEEFHDE